MPCRVQKGKPLSIVACAEYVIGPINLYDPTVPPAVPEQGDMTLPPAIVLAGGKALRMGGGDKTLLRIGGKPLLRHILHALNGQVGALALNANGDPARFAAFGLPVLPDMLPDTCEADAGPLGGILAGLDWAATLGAAALLSVPGDTPFLPGDLARRLTLAAQGGAALAASPDADGRLRRHPTCALWQVGRRHALRAALDGGLRKVGLWADLENATTVRFESQPRDPFFNVNTPGDLTRAEALLHAV